MNPHIEKIKRLRLFLLARIADLTTAQLNTVPPGFNNNIIWNLAHLVSAQQSICYIRSGLPAVVAEEYITPFMPGTKPEKPVSEEEINAIKQRFIATTDQMQEDYQAGVFVSYTHSERIKQVYNVDVNNIDDAIDFVLYHEGFHLGCIFMLKHLV